MKPINFFRSVIAILVISPLPFAANGQQHPVISSYMQQPLLLSPAATGVDSSTYLSVTHRSQWRKYDNFSDGQSPASQLQMVTASMQLAIVPGDWDWWYTVMRWDRYKHLI